MESSKWFLFWVLVFFLFPSSLDHEPWLGVGSRLVWPSAVRIDWPSSDHRQLLLLAGERLFVG